MKNTRKYFRLFSLKQISDKYGFSIKKLSQAVGALGLSTEVKYKNTRYYNDLGVTLLHTYLTHKECHKKLLKEYAEMSD